MFEKNLNDLVRGLRNSKSNEVRSVSCRPSQTSLCFCSILFLLHQLYIELGEVTQFDES